MSVWMTKVTYSLCSSHDDALAAMSQAIPFIEGLGSDICSPFFSNEDVLHVIMAADGDILSVASTGATCRIHNTNGMPSSACYNYDGSLYVTDYAHQGVLLVDLDNIKQNSNNNNQSTLVTTYEDKPLKGPSDIVVHNDTVYFTDSGPMGETGLHSATGSIFSIVQSTVSGNNSPAASILRPITLNNLAYPSGIAVSNNGKYLYVAEMMTNRLLRYFQQPEGVFHGSVFHQFSGGVGPSAVVTDKKGNIYVALYDTKESSTEGTVAVLSSQGKLINEIITKGAEITGLAINNNNVLYITEKSNGSIQKFNIELI